MGNTVIVADGQVLEVTESDDPGDFHYPTCTIVGAFTDSHLHPFGYAALTSGTSLFGATSIDDVVDRVAEAATGLGPGTAVVAQRLDDTPLGRLPERTDLDRAVPENPAIVYRYCGHVAVANTAALAAAGIDQDTPDPIGGSFDRGSDGLPNGVLRETALDTVGVALEGLVPPPDDRATVAAINGLAGLGIAGIGGMVAAGSPIWCGVGDELDSLCRLGPEIRIRVDAIIIADTSRTLEAGAGRLAEAGPRVGFWGWKAFADGSLGGHTAAMHEPFSGTTQRGTMRLDPDHTYQMGRCALDLGGIVAVHAIGDRAIDETLDVFERLIDNGAEPHRLRMEHVSVPTASAITRMAKLGIVASIQPSFLTSEASWVPGRLGPGRAAYPFAAMQAAGVSLLGGSDCPVERPDPLAGIAAAVNRPGWDDGESLDIGSALALFTDAPARHFGQPEPLTPGSAADLVMIDGVVGSDEATVEAVFRSGRPVNDEPAPWPG